MKHIVTAFIVFLISVNISAQNVSYQNVVKLANMESVSDVSSILRSWGYKLGDTCKTNGNDTYYWGWGDVVYDKSIDDWKCGKGDWSLAALIKSEIYIIFTFHFQSSRAFEQVKKQIKDAGWKVADEYQDELGLKLDFRKEETDDFIVLTESTSPAGGFSVGYFRYF